MVTEVRELLVAVGSSYLRVADVRHLFPPVAGGAVGRRRDLGLLKAVGLHHDAVVMPAGDLDYSGSTLDEDLERLGAIYRHGLAQGWGGFPYHWVASPNGRTFYTTDVGLFGATVARRNHEVLGLALMGNFMYLEPGVVQLCAAGTALVACGVLTGFVLRPWSALAPWMHRELALPGQGTACPGDSAVRWAGRITELAVARGRSIEGVP